ncbi:MAG: DUF835 domain-containing protein [Euryarchaeota archaeon]|nr:DUF835 domain-containing protein [Euryarchaeota archaeon]
MEEAKLSRGLAVCRNLIVAGHSGLFITRMRLDAQGRKAKPAKGLWLSHLVGRDILGPNQLRLMGRHMADFISTNEQAVVLLEGVDYLVLENGLEEVLKLIHQICDEAVEHGAVFVISLDPGLFGERELVRLRRAVDSSNRC